MLILAALLSTVGSTTATAAPNVRPPLQIWMNNDRRFREGERARVQVDADVDGFLLVLNYETDGRLKVLFPIDPRDDARVAAGRRYEIRDDRGESAFRAVGDGTGLIYSAISRDPWRLEEMAAGGGWDYSRLLVDRDNEDPEAAITDLVQQLAGSGGFDYDVVDYRVYGATTTTYAYNDYYVRGPLYAYADDWYCSRWSWHYDGCYGWPYSRYSFGFGYYPYRYRYPYTYPYYPYTPYYPHWPSGTGRGPVVAGRPRNYTVFQPESRGNVERGRFGGTRVTTTTSVPPINWRPRSVARPAGTRGREVSRDAGDRRVVAPPARRARAERPSVPANRERVSSGNRERGSYNPPARSEPRSQPRSEPRSQPRSEPRSEPRSQPRSAEPSRAPRGNERPAGGNDRGSNARGNSGSNGGGHSPPSRPRRP